MIDTIAKPTKFHLEKPIKNLSLTNDSVTGTMSYQITLADGEQQVKEPFPSIWTGILTGFLTVVFVGFVYWIKKRRPKRVELADTIEKDAKELFRQTDAYKLFVTKGYYSVNRRAALDLVTDQEIKALCEAVVAAYPSYSDWLQEQNLPEKDYQFCCLVKSGLSTFELAEIYCVSESAIFKRKQKMKKALS